MLPVILPEPMPDTGDLNSKRLLILSTGEVVLLRRLDGRVGFLQRRDEGRHRWVWLSDQMLARVRPYSGDKPRPQAPDCELEV